MIATLWARKIMMFQKEYSDTPRLLKEQVREILIENGFGDPEAGAAT